MCNYVSHTRSLTPYPSFAIKSTTIHVISVYKNTSAKFYSMMRWDVSTDCKTLPTKVAFSNLFKTSIRLRIVSVSQAPVFLIVPETQTSLSICLIQMMADRFVLPFLNVLLSIHSFGVISANWSWWVSSLSSNTFCCEDL